MIRALILILLLAACTPAPQLPTDFDSSFPF
ncbi:hypothetical protein [Yoonia vestfoldensis]|nr:hypothetical protein [Yoonia vestfoldensis]